MTLPPTDGLKTQPAPSGEDSTRDARELSEQKENDIIAFAAAMYSAQLRVNNKQHEALMQRKNHVATQRHWNEVGRIRLADENTTFQAFHKREMAHLDVELYAIEDEDKEAESQLRSIKTNKTVRTTMESPEWTRRRKESKKISENQLACKRDSRC